MPSRSGAGDDGGQTSIHVGDPSDDEPLQAVGIEHARAVIVAANIEKLRRVGADTVPSLAVIGGQLLVRSALGEEDVESLDAAKNLSRRV